MGLEIGDIVLCTVDRIVGTIVFVKIEGEKKEGSLILSEVAPGRIRNLRNYVVPKKKIVCKVLRVSPTRVDLSLRRVTKKEEKEVKEKFKQENSYRKIIKSIIKEDAEKTIKKIEESNSIYDFLEESKENSEKLEKLVGKQNSKKILDIIKNQKIKKIILKKEFELSSDKENGLELIKKILNDVNKAKINYLSAGKYSIKIESEDMREAAKELKNILKEIEEKAKKEKMLFSTDEK